MCLHCSSGQSSVHCLTCNCSKLNISALTQFKRPLVFLLQVALRIRPLSDAEQEEAATIVAHRVDEQVRWPPSTPLLCVWVCVCSLFTSVPILYLTSAYIVTDGLGLCGRVLFQSPLPACQEVAQIRYPQWPQRSQQLFLKMSLFVTLKCHISFLNECWMTQTCSEKDEMCRDP